MLSPPPLPLLLYLMCRRVSGVSEGLSTPLPFSFSSVGLCKIAPSVCGRFIFLFL